MIQQDTILKLLSLEIRTVLGQLPKHYFNDLQEIRLRINGPLLVIYKNKEYFVSRIGGLTQVPQNVYVVNDKALRETLEYISNYSLYAFEEEIKKGFITIQGGHRIGLAGKVIVEGGKIKTIQNIAFINIRIANEVKGCAREILPYLFDHCGMFYHTIIISPPRCGKTTLLRDVIRQVSDGNTFAKGMTVGVVDERSEIGGCYLGTPQNDLGARTDVLDCCPKAEGMLMLIRSMSPMVLAVDEIGSREDIEAIEYVINSGCKLICTVHGQSLEDIIKKPILNQLIKRNIFERYVVLSNQYRIGQIIAIYDQKCKPIIRSMNKTSN